MSSHYQATKDTSKTRGTRDQGGAGPGDSFLHTGECRRTSSANLHSLWTSVHKLQPMPSLSLFSKEDVEAQSSQVTNYPIPHISNIPSQEMQVGVQASGSPKDMALLCQCLIPFGSPNRKYLFYTHLKGRSSCH